MSLKRRSNLGFDDSLSDEELENPQKVIPRRRAKLPKLSFKTEEIKPKDIDDVRPALGKTEDKDNELDDNDDYMKMVILDDELTGPQRLKLKDEPKSKPGYNFEDIHDKKKKKTETTSLFGQVESGELHDDVLKVIPNSQLRNSSKGLSIMEKMGFKIGDTLGKDNKNENAILEPIIGLQREDRTGIKEKEPSLQENVKLSNGITNKDTKEYRERLNTEQNTQRKEKILHNLQKYCWKFSGDDDDVSDIEKVDLLGINVLWRGYVKFIQKLQKDKREQRRIKNPDEFEEIKDGEEDEEKEEDIDDELEMFEEMTIDEKISKVHIFLRSEFNYCYYCGVRYEDQEDLFEHCPGLSLEDHY